MAGAAESPGDSIPATSMKFSASSANLIIKSPPDSFALNPAKEVITFLDGTCSTLIAPAFNTKLSPSAVVFTPSLSSIESAVGPIIQLPCAVGVTRTPFPLSVGSWNNVCFTNSPASLSNKQYSPFTAFMLIGVLLTIACILSAYTPAAFITYLAFISPDVVVRTYSLPSLFIAFTLERSLKSTPFVAAFSAIATVSMKGSTIAPVGTYRAFTTASLIFGSISRISSCSMMRSPFTPFAIPLSYSSCKPFPSCSLRQSTSDPFLLYANESCFESSSIISDPLTFIRAFMLLGFASYPPCTMPEFALDVPSHTSVHRSSTQIFLSYLDRNLATEHPITPPPIIAMSYMHYSP